jgi:hypothetical protein|tara:strand:- start:200 stop:385 length:186 start_codon:yes stop_codon:yes gene_type:complete
MDIQYIKIPLRTDADASQLLEVAYELVQQAIQLVESYGYEAEGDDGSGDAPEELAPCVSAK